MTRWILLMVVGTPLIASCFPRPNTAIGAFDGECPPEACQYNVVEGSAEVVETFHPGDHALRLEPNSRVRFLTRLNSENRVEFTGWCEAGGLVVASQPVEVMSDMLRRYSVRLNPGTSQIDFATAGSPCMIDDILGTNSSDPLFEDSEPL